MNDNTKTYQHTETRAAGNPSIFDLTVVQYLLAGMYFLFGVTGLCRSMYREQALRLRRADTENRQINRSLKNAENHINAWSGDYKRHWRTCLLALSLDPNAPDIRFASRNIVCRLRNAAAARLRPKHHSQAFLTLMELPDLCRFILWFMDSHITHLRSAAPYDIGVRAPP